MPETPKRIHHSFPLTADAQGHQMTAIECSVCGSSVFDWDRHLVWHANLHPHGGAKTEKVGAEPNDGLTQS
jgi:hypothetical protein